MPRVTRRRAGLVGGLVGIAALGIGAGVALERHAIGRIRLRPDPYADEPFFRLPAERVTTVLAEDGVPLHVEETGPADAPLTLVFCHGYTQQLAVWHFQRKAFAADPAVRCVYWDQRSHGRSGRSRREHQTIDQLGRDLHDVLEAVAPEGPVVLVGHSMGGMTVMALADQYPHLFGPRVRGVALLATSTGKLAELTFGLPAAVAPVTRRTLPWLTRGMARRPEPFERTRQIGTDLAFLVARFEAFGDPGVSPALVEFVERMTAATRVDVIAEFYDTFRSHEKLHALDVLHDVPTLVAVGSKDRITPVEHSEDIAQALPSAELAVYEGVGHMLQLERPDEVTEQLRHLVKRATA